MFLPIALCCLPLAIGACAGTQKKSGPVSYSETAFSNYKKGVAELKDENFLEAKKFFNFVKNKFPFSRYSTLAELRLADTSFKQEQFGRAIDAYKLFVKFHPTHPHVVDGYASFRVVGCYVEQIPSDWFLLPPSHEKDQGATRQALAELSAFKRRYPQSKHLAEAEKLRRGTIRRLVAHELYVARFYLKRGKPKATILRLEGVVGRFPDGVDPDLMLLLGKTYLKVKDKKKAKATFSALIKKYPKDVKANKAKRYLAELGQP
ncbi:MAG: outer membrane protein assembly factor BamD [Deltaproteobacteria bacterium]|nr:outer membrane protein assembly factor BamD [Deltaproteobacteria bacterium]